MCLPLGLRSILRETAGTLTTRQVHVAAQTPFLADLNKDKHTYHPQELQKVGEWPAACVISHMEFIRTSLFVKLENIYQASVWAQKQNPASA